MAKFSDFLKGAFLLILIIQFLPPLVKSLKTSYTGLFEAKTKVGVVPIKGMILDSSRAAMQLKKFFKDPEIKAIVLKIDSPGGVPAASEAIFLEIMELKKEYVKPVIAFTENFCTSGAYWVAAAADHIIAQPTSLIGSIGVYIGFPNFHEFIENHKVHYTVIETGKYKTAGMMFKDLTDDQHMMLQGLSNETYKEFVTSIAERRPAVASVAPTVWADGKVFTGRQAKEIGLIDELGAQSTLANALKAKAPIEGEIVYVHPEKPGVMTKLFGAEEQESEENVTSHASFASTIAKEVMEKVSGPIFY